MARSLPPVSYKQTCDYDGAGHNKIIMPGKPAFQVVVGEARGKYHGIRCYKAALAKYKALKSKVGLK